MLLRCCLFCLLQLAVSWQVMARQTPSDSLLTAAAKDPDSTTVLALTSLCYQNIFSNHDSAIFFGNKAIETAQKINYPKGLALAYTDLGTVYFYKSDFDNTQTYWNKALQTGKQMGDKSRMGSVYIKLGVLHFKRGDFNQALQHQLQALKIYEQLQDQNTVGQVLNNIAAVYEHQNQLDKALEYYQQSLALKQALNDNAQIGMAHINIGNIYYKKQDLQPAKKHLQEAISRLSAADKNAAQYLGTAYNNLSEVYIISNQPDSASQNITKALSIRKEINDVNGVASSLNNLGRILTLQRKFQPAETTLLEAKTIAEEHNLIIEKNKIYLNLAELYKVTNRPGKALDFYILHTQTKDSLLNETSHRQITELQVQYETEKKEQQLALQKAELAQQQIQLKKNQIAVVALVITLALLLVIFLLARSRFKRKQQLLEKEQKLSLQEAYIQATINSQEQERKRFAQDLHDGLGQLISALRLTIGNVKQNSTLEERAHIAEKADKILSDMHLEIRGITFNLMPQTLIQHGLLPALKEMAMRLNNTGGINIKVYGYEMPDRLAEVKEISLYRIIQEWVNNVLKYSGATTIEVQLVKHDHEINITIEDNGRGFNPQKLQASDGNGWKNIQSRLNLINGDIEIDSTPNRTGTTAIIRLPDATEITAEPTKETRTFEAETVETNTV
ncbi:MAG: tetratricopeptide repeat protein [Moraxellaceae bacterium]|nr:MAG: tetratricopeptide repeat protein [Moraxellaceae bacterium]